MEQDEEKGGDDNDGDGGDDDDDDDDDDCGGLCFAQGDKFIGVPLAKYFPAPSSFPYFVTPYTLNSQDTTQLIFWANGTDDSSAPFSRSGFYAFHLPHDGSITSKDDIGPPTAVAYTAAADGVVLDFVAGGFTDGKSDPSLLVAMTATHLLYSTGGNMVSLKLPCTFASPVPMEYDPQTGARILGPVTHGRTVSLTVSPADSNVIAVTGWTSVADNEGAENVWVTTDGGATWQNITSNLRAASGVVGKVRPGGLLIVDLLENNARAVLVGTSNGIQVAFLEGARGEHAFFTFDPAQVAWKRFGSEAEFPIVLTAKISYEHYSDTLVAATFGRGIYVMKNGAKKALVAAMGGEERKPRVPEKSSAVFFPAQM